MALYDQNWDINSYNRAYGNNNLDTQFQGEGDIMKYMDQDYNYRPPGSFLRSGVGSFYNQQPAVTQPHVPHVPEWISSPNRPSIPERTGILENLKTKLSGFTTPTMEFMKKMGGVTPEKKAAYDAIMGDRGSLGTGERQLGDYGGKQYELTKTPSGLKIGSDIIGYGEGYDKNLYSAFGSKSIEEMEQKKLDWAQQRYEKLGRRGLGTDMYNQLIKNRPEVLDVQIKTGDQITQRPTGWEPTPGRDYSDRELSQIGREHYTGPGMAFEARPSSTFTTPSGKRGYSGGRAEGGRIGYQGGELVEDEYMAEATPAGMMEENIEEVQGEPTREQLEAIALEIFRLPLEELNEEQLNVVYQAAMEQQPSEEEVQFAAQEGPGEGIASLV